MLDAAFAVVDGDGRKVEGGAGGREAAALVVEASGQTDGKIGAAGLDQAAGPVGEIPGGEVQARGRDLRGVAAEGAGGAGAEGFVDADAGAAGVDVAGAGHEIEPGPGRLAAGEAETVGAEADGAAGEVLAVDRDGAGGGLDLAGAEAAVLEQPGDKGRGGAAVDARGAEFEIAAGGDEAAVGDVGGGAQAGVA